MSAVYINRRIETVTLSDAVDGMFSVTVTEKCGRSTVTRLTDTEVLRNYGAYLTAEDRLRITKRPSCKPRRMSGWRCSLM